MCFSSQSMLEYSVYYFCYLFYVLHKFSVVVVVFFSPKYSKEYLLIASAGIEIILKPPEKVFIFPCKPKVVLLGSYW